jgi:hypothetical protein
MARAKLARLEEFQVGGEMVHDDWVLDVVPTSGMYSQNLRSVVRKLRIYVEAKMATSRTSPVHVTIIIHLVPHFRYIQYIFSAHALLILLYAITSIVCLSHSNTSPASLGRPPHS